MTTPTPTQASSNTVLFEMMMHYKTSMEKAQEQTAAAQAATHNAIKHYKRAREETARVHAENSEMIQVARMMGRSMRRKTAIQHHRDHLIDQLTTNIDDLFDAIDLVVDTNLEHSLGVDYISMHKNAIRQRIICAAETCNQRVAVWNVSDEELAADEVIDLAGDTTEEEEEEEQPEDEVEPTPWNNIPLAPGQHMIWNRDTQNWVPHTEEN